MNKAPWIVSDRKINIALVGCGRIARSHIAAIEQNSDDCQLVAVCDVDRQALDQISSAHKVPAYTKLADLLAEIDCDAVSLCTPSGLHAQQAILAARAGKHVITEKPMATRWQDGVDMVRACDEAGVRLFVVKQNRLNPTVQLLKQAVDQRRFGQIYMVTINVFWIRPQDYYDQAAWRGTWEFDGGALMNQASHYIDLLHWLIGPVDNVQAMTGTLARHIETEDSAVMNVRWRHGALGSVNVTMLTYPKNLEGSITVLGEKGTVRIGGVAVNQIQEWQFVESKPEDEQVMQANYETTSVYGFGHPLYYQNVVATLRGRAQPETDGRQGLHSLELLMAAYRSARDNCTISLPLTL